MEIAVCVKQVPDVPSIRIDRKRMTVIREGVESIINPMDQIALETALDLRSREGGQVTVITMGPKQSEEALRECLAAGADRAVLLSDPAFAGADTLATSRVLAKALSRLRPLPDLILCGVHTTDSDTGHVGPQIAEELRLPQVCGVHEIHAEGQSLVLKKAHGGVVDTIRVVLPALLTINKGSLESRHLRLGSLEKAFSGVGITRWDRGDLGLRAGEVGLEGSATHVWRLRNPPPKRNGVIITGSPQRLVEHLLHKLEELTLLEEERGNG
jgi:electron transfer flavoprotein beta subunit